MFISSTAKKAAMLKKRCGWRAAALFVLLALCSPAVLALNSTASPAQGLDDNSTGTKVWNNPSRVNSSDNQRATVAVNDLEASHFLKATNFSISLPSAAIIDGIVVDMERSVNSVNGGSIVRDNAVRLVKNGVILADDRATNTSWTTADTYETHGNSTDLWGTTWSAAELNSPAFGAAVSVTKANADSGSRTARIDHIRITIYYHLDLVAPVIGVLGNNPETVEAFGTYTDAGAEAYDDNDGNITGAIAATGTVNTSTLGTYAIIYAVNDSSGNNATANRTVNVVDTTPPVITVLGSNPAVAEWNSTYTDQGAEALDNYDGNITGAATTAGAVNTLVLGAHTLTYSANDSSGNNATANRTVTVSDTTPPVLALLGENNITIETSTVYADAGAAAWDARDGNITAAIAVNNTVNTNISTTYLVTYDINDSSGNLATITRTVNVVPPPKPPEDRNTGLGPTAFSYFAGRTSGQGAQSAGSTGTAGAEGSATGTTGSSASAEASSSTAGASGATTGADTAAATTASAAAGPAAAGAGAEEESDRAPNPITGAVTGTRQNTRWYWLAGLGALAIGLLGAGWRNRRRITGYFSEEEPPRE
jgi:hypothetical protein